MKGPLIERGVYRNYLRHNRLITKVDTAGDKVVYLKGVINEEGRFVPLGSKRDTCSIRGFKAWMGKKGMVINIQS